jgi:hypothetical protein
MSQGTARRASRPARRLACLLAVVVFGGSFACAFLDPLHTRSDFDDIQKRFTQELRWGQIDKASEFVAPEIRDEFKSLAPRLSELRITDYTIVKSDLAPDLKHATVDVQYSGYREDELVERTVMLREVWTRDEASGEWQVKLDLDKLQRALGIPVAARTEPVAAH